MSDKEIVDQTQHVVDYLRKLGYIVLSAEDAAFITREIELGPCDVGAAQIKALLTQKPL